ncbi:hypothetical protein AC578_10663 [Pseudocercospora eumusae]|uniref:Sm domain-containing protein n=1 Tax=Pseudocercospora eumusae TaxID=321146 RepID=A0A139HJ70_9PEZI|nr:hypothetical protein AC578_10663 [Pseudocercospora eumusae]
MLFFSFFKTLVNHEVTVELKNDISLRGTLKSVDQYLNIKLDDISVVDEMSYPHLSSVKNVFIRGSVVRYVHLPAAAVDTPLLEDATRREQKPHKLLLKPSKAQVLRDFGLSMCDRVRQYRDTRASLSDRLVHKRAT